jgi:peptidoglycan biosynthesis protein MviN/MurJ (putative lipid II flippase)
MSAGRSTMPESHIRESHYRRLLAMTVISFAAMYVLMYAMVNTFANVHMNVNQFYMAGLMAASMVIIEVAIMRAMYHDKRMNAAIILAGGIVLAGFWVMMSEIDQMTAKLKELAE